MDIRIVRGRNQHLWGWIAALVAVSGVAVGAAMLFGDATARGETVQVGAASDLGADRAPVMPVVVESFASVGELKDRELGRLLRLTGWAESPARSDALYVRSTDGRRILVRFEPSPPEGRLRRFHPGGGVDVNGYLQKLSRAEFDVWVRTLGVSVPRPPPGVKFGDLPDSSFARVEALFIKDYYLSVRPEGLDPGPATGPRRTAAPPSDRPASTSSAPAPAVQTTPAPAPAFPDSGPRVP